MVTLSVPAPPTLLPSKGIKRESSTFDEDVPMTSVDDRPAKKVRFTDEDLSKDLRRKIILSALEDQNKTNGNSALFSELRKKFTIRASDPAAPDASELCQTIQCLMLVVGRLELHCAPLIGDIIRTNWAGRPNNFCKLYMQFLQQIISAHPDNTPKVVRMLVKHLTYETVKDAQTAGTVFNSRRDIFAIVHKMLEAILGLAPTGFQSLLSAISESFPHKDRKKLHQTTYIVNILEILNYAPAARTKILGSIFEKMMNLDVEIQTNSLNLDEDEGEELDQQLDMTLDSKTTQNLSDSGIGEDEDESDSDSDDEEEDQESGEPRTVEKMQEIVNKLDAMLSLVFAYYSSRLPKEGTTNPSQEEMETFELLLHFFENIILPTKSQHVQFILFWAAQKSPVFMDIFLGMLVERALGAESSDARKSAAAYVASFVGRAQKLDRANTRKLVKYLCSWLQKFVNDRDWECSGPDVQKFSGFYVIFQAVIYIFCFKWQDLERKSESTGEDDIIASEIRTWAPGLEVIDRLVTSKFNPLKVCSPTVVNQFAEVANHLGLVYCYTIIERNKHGQLFNSGASVSNSGRPEATQLKTYFPFDPFRLPMSKRWIDQLYKHWEDPPGMNEDGVEGEENDDDSDESEDEDEVETKSEDENAEEGSESDSSEAEDSEDE
ncbi:hypothetical protein TWF694_008552 [Orbilia ellipsospora]|uniref:RNA polymerase I-specific transcription initiation factor RRN3 n=1 Tax=Orbilia ellipsospora TaxID=2528407 RepID=A0AAV9XGX9_9PEZI